MARSRCRIRFKGASMIDFDADSETEFEAPATWVDVARRLSSLEPAQALWRMRPSELEGARVDWTGLTLLIRSEEHTSELQSLMRISYAVFFLHKKRKVRILYNTNSTQ